MDVEYNLLNLPSKVTNTANGMTASYSYLADGREGFTANIFMFAARAAGLQPAGSKLACVDSTGNGLVYIGGMVYRQEGKEYTLESTSFSGGRVMHTGTGYDALYFVTDHLGSTRATVDSEGNIPEQNDYYAFGSRMDNGLPMSTANRYRFSGKEQQVVADINLLDFGARMYDDEICRWTTVDPLAEKYYSMTPYNYCANNPVMFVDPDGEEKIVSLYIQKPQSSYSVDYRKYKKQYDEYKTNCKIDDVAKRYEDWPNIVTLTAHGVMSENEKSADLITVLDDNGKKILLDADGIANFLNEKSEVLNNKYSFDSEHTAVVLRSCGVAQNGENSIACDLSAKLGCYVIAPTESVFSNGQVCHHGKWQVFYNGESKGKFSGKKGAIENYCNDFYIKYAIYCILHGAVPKTQSDSNSKQ